MGWDVKAFALMVAGSTGIFALCTNYRLEATERQSYLLLLGETLRAKAVHAQDCLIFKPSNYSR